MMERNEDLSLSLSLRSSGDHQQYRQIQLDVMPAPTQSSAALTPEIKMMERNENLGFSLSLGSSSTPYMHRQWQLNLVPPQWTELLASSSVPNRAPEMAARLMLRDIDVIRETAAEMESQEAGSSPNSTLSSVCRTRDHKTMIDGGGGGKISKEDGVGCRKKLRLSKDQSVVLEESFKEHNTLTPKEKEALAKQLNLRPRQVEVWVQNRRARTKLKQTEVDCALLKWCCENLTDENQQLRKEVAKLRELKLSPQSYMNMTLPATPTMCPSCECVAPSNNGAATRPANVDHPCL